MSTHAAQLDVIKQRREQLSKELTAVILSLCQRFGSPKIVKEGYNWPSCAYVFPDFPAVVVEAYWTGEDYPVPCAVVVDGVKLSPNLVSDRVWYDEFFKDEPGL